MAGMGGRIWPLCAPYSVLFNPDTQAQKFDPKGAYRKMWLAEASRTPPETALAFYDACPRNWNLRPRTHVQTRSSTLKMGASVLFARL